MCDWNWNTIWTAFAAIGTFGTLMLLCLPAIKGKINKIKKNKRLNKYFEYLFKNEKELENFIEITFTKKSPKISYSSNDQDGRKGEYLTIQFNKKYKLFYVYEEGIKFNEVIIPKGYNLFKVISKDIICLQIIDDNSGSLNELILYSKFTKDKDNFKNVTF